LYGKYSTILEGSLKLVSTLRPSGSLVSTLSSSLSGLALPRKRNRCSGR